MENFAPSCERNKHVILERSHHFFENANKVLEIGSYSGQHAFHFVEQLPHLIWQATDCEEHVKKLQLNIDNSGSSNFARAFTLDVSNSLNWPKCQYDIIYSANTLHIMSWRHVEQFFEASVGCIEVSGYLIIYGPFKYRGEYTSQSNAEFESWLKDRDSQSGIRDFEAVNELAISAGLKLIEDIPMPANNRLLIWQKNP